MAKSHDYREMLKPEGVFILPGLSKKDALKKI